MIKNEMETIIREQWQEPAKCWPKNWNKNLRVKYLPDDISHLSWDFIREFKDLFVPDDWEAIMKYHTTHTKEEKEFLKYIKKYVPDYSLEKM